MPVRNRLAELHAEIAIWRRHLHQYPELLFDLPLTAQFVEDRLHDIGVDDVVTGLATTGLVAVIHGKTNESGKVIGLRADMDALPIHETSGVAYCSTTPNRMHACGHDGHTAILLGAAKYLAETRCFDGTAVLIFQPAEEGGAGGQVLCDEGLMDRWGIQEVYGLHNMPGRPVGHFAIRSGPLMASSDEFDIHVTGYGGHAAAPHHAIDTTLVASQIVVSLQSVVSRNIDPVKRVALTIGTFQTDSAQSNIIPHTARLCGTLRTLDPECRTLSMESVERVVDHTAAAFGASAAISWTPGYPVTVNHPQQTQYAIEAACAVAGEAQVDVDVDPILPAEDFSFMLKERPGAYIFLGNGDSEMCHHPSYIFDDDALPYGASWFVELVERRMPAQGV